MNNRQIREAAAGILRLVQNMDLTHMKPEDLEDLIYGAQDILGFEIKSEEDFQAILKELGWQQ